MDTILTMYGTGEGEPPKPDEVARALAESGWEDVRVDERGRVIASLPTSLVPENLDSLEVSWSLYHGGYVCHLRPRDPEGVLRSGFDVPGLPTPEEAAHSATLERGLCACGLYWEEFERWLYLHRKLEDTAGAVARFVLEDLENRCWRRTGHFGGWLSSSAPGAPEKREWSWHDHLRDEHGADRDSLRGFRSAHRAFLADLEEYWERYGAIPTPPPPPDRYRIEPFLHVPMHVLLGFTDGCGRRGR